MKAKSRRKLEMGRRALEFSRAHPDASPGYEAAVARLQEQLNRADILADQQRGGILEVRMASGRKRELRRAMRRGHLRHLAKVARVAERDVPELGQKFLQTLSGGTYLGFRTAARGMAAEAEARREILIKHGLSATVLDGLTESLNLFDEAVKQGADGRRAHVGASAELDEIATEVAQIVSVMDGLNQVRFSRDAELLASWINASAVVATPRPPATPTPPTGDVPPAAGEVKPAA